MIKVFSDEEIAKARRTKKNLLLFWFGILFIYLALLGTMMGINIYQVVVYRSRHFHIPFVIVSTILTFAFGAFTMFFFSIKYRLTRKYVKMFRDMEKGLSTLSEGKFIEYDENIIEKDGVFFYSMCLNCKPLKRGDITLRKVLIEHTIPKIDLKSDQKIRFLTHANILREYEILD